MDTTFEIATFLEDQRAVVIDRAAEAVARSHLPHYDEAGPGEVVDRLTALYHAVVASVTAHSVEPILSHADDLASARQRTGHGLSEVQRAINALEEQLWVTVVEDVAAEEQGHVLGVVSTILGALKDRVACDYLAAATSTRPKSLRLDELFKGTSAGFM